MQRGEQLKGGKAQREYESFRNISLCSADPDTPPLSPCALVTGQTATGLEKLLVSQAIFAKRRSQLVPREVQC